MSETKGYYSEAQKKAIYTYRAKNKDAYNKYQRESCLLYTSPSPRD